MNPIKIHFLILIDNKSPVINEVGSRHFILSPPPSLETPFSVDRPCGNWKEILNCPRPSATYSRFCDLSSGLRFGPPFHPPRAHPTIFRGFVPENKSAAGLFLVAFVVCLIWWWSTDNKRPTFLVPGHLLASVGERGDPQQTQTFRCKLFIRRRLYSQTKETRRWLFRVHSTTFETAIRERIFVSFSKWKRLKKRGTTYIHIIHT